MHNKQRVMRFQIKSVADDGTFAGLLSPYGNVDDGGDVVEAGAFAKSIQEHGNTVPMLWQHKPDCPIGELTLTDEADGLYCSGKFLLDIPQAQQAYTLLKAQVIKGLSIGYETVKSQVVNGVRHLKEIRLYEGSVVTFPMNPLALISSVKHKGESKADFSDELAQRQLCDTGPQLFAALSDALYPLPYSGLSRDEMLSLAETTLTQFTEEYMAYLPLYLDFLASEFGMDTKDWAKHEQKQGRTLSKLTRNTLSDAHEHMKSAVDIIATMLSEPDESDITDDQPDDLDDLTVKAHADLIGNMLGLLR